MAAFYGVGAEYIRKNALVLALQGIVYPTAGASPLVDHALLPWFYECLDSEGLALSGPQRCCRQRSRRAEGRLWAFAFRAFLELTHSTTTCISSGWHICLRLGSKHPCNLALEICVASNGNP